MKPIRDPQTKHPVLQTGSNRPEHAFGKCRPLPACSAAVLFLSSMIFFVSTVKNGLNAFLVLLYAFFFPAGLMKYLYYLGDRKKWKLCFSLLLFHFSYLSRAMAVSFPVSLLLIDFLPEAYSMDKSGTAPVRNVAAGYHSRVSLRKRINLTSLQIT
jgi:hypothetical protein